MEFFKNFFKHSDSAFFPLDDEELGDKCYKYDDIFSDTFKVNDFFENQLNELLKSFSFRDFSDIIPEPSPPSFDSTRNYDHSKSLRDQFLKDEFQNLNEKNDHKVDQDLDGKLVFGIFDSFLDEKNIPFAQLYNNSKKQNRFFSSQVQSFKATTLPNGTIQTENVVKDKEGNHEKVVCHQIGIKKYCVIKRKYKNGKEEETENFININEDEKDEYTKAYRNYL